MNENYLNELNPVQRSAVMQTDGPVMIIAGAGSGKTRVLTYRIAHLLNHGVSAFSILALTFTNKAAREMKERIHHIVGSTESANLWMGTFHSVFARILRFEAEKLGYPSNFTIYDTDDSKSLIKTILNEMGLDDKIYKPSLVLNRISGAKNNLISAQQYLSMREITEEDRLSGKPKLGLVYQAYETRCFKASAMDFDDLLFKTNVLFKNYPEVLYKYQDKFRFIMVDEYQDTNFSQYLIVKKLAARHLNICVVGDDAQSIYAFRGANIQNILNFERDYPELKMFKLEQNYRSTKTIVEAANAVISKNKAQLRKVVWTDNNPGERIKVMLTASDNEEGAMVANQIFEQRMQNQMPYKDFAVLYRTNAQSRALEESLRKRSIPYRIYGGLSFYKRKEIKDLLAYFRLTINPNDEEALKRVINYPARGIGKTTLEKIIVAADEKGVSIWNLISALQEYDVVKGAAVRKIVDFVNMIRSFRHNLESTDAFVLAMNIAKSSGLLKELNADKTPEGISRYENIQALLNGIQEFVETKPESEDEVQERTLDVYVRDIALLTDADEDDEKDAEKVSLMTIHAAKGLEFKSVFVVGLEENLFPSQLSLNSVEELEEERRLFYVAITRAEKHLVLSHAETRYRWGQITHAEPSRFIQEIDQSLLEYNEPPAKKGFLDFSDDFDSYAGFKKRPAASAFQAKAEQSGSYTRRGTSESPATAAAQKKEISNFIPDNLNNLQSGMEVIHEKFGKGKVLQIDGRNSERKATVFFQEVGQKQLLLKFAKLKIIG
ncbi:MAG: UvrD-helicase domain-containing protein [Bacteroidetes bacterium]|nr:UvrD-helicase domain-containing protein [Bacteroidota bacterium]